LGGGQEEPKNGGAIGGVGWRCDVNEANMTKASYIDFYKK